LERKSIGESSMKTWRKRNGTVQENLLREKTVGKPKSNKEGLKPRGSILKVEKKKT